MKELHGSSLVLLIVGMAIVIIAGFYFSQVFGVEQKQATNATNTSNQAVSTTSTNTGTTNSINTNTNATINLQNISKDEDEVVSGDYCNNRCTASQKCVKHFECATCALDENGRPYGECPCGDGYRCVAK